MIRWDSRLPFKCFKILVILSTLRSSKSFHRDWNSFNEFFEYTRGRFVHDEEHELAVRRVKFDMNELAKVASQSSGSSECVQVEKLPDGMFNKTFLFTMADGTQVIGKGTKP
ncbi:hypothetical protein N7535_002511 [Penicillium sp. DV-2018c]|nr:hypothetical protein N7461_001803 [Penicillium sp. DV-2018c]KAJ5575585.1 hypothetical protein N7535_002511 [Penicillium sp. DV-2018c]